jgi:hypothetical protein
MLFQTAVRATALTAALALTTLAIATLAMPVAAQAFDETKYPDLKGQWRRAETGTFRFDPSKPWGPGQEAPLTPEYQAIFEANLASQASGGQGVGVTYTCLSPGMPRVVNGYGPTEFVVTPSTTHILVENIYDSRRVFTDGRPWPEHIEPSLLGYSIGRWIDADGDGRFDELDVETRGFKGPRAFDASGVPLHKDNQTVVKERFFLDKADPAIFHDEVTVFDNALTRPWTVLKSYRRQPSPQPVWIEYVCAEANNHRHIGNENYMLSADGLLMPTRKGQQPPDLKHFDTSQK